MTDSLRNLQWRALEQNEKTAFREGLAWGVGLMGFLAILWSIVL